MNIDSINFRFKVKKNILGFQDTNLEWLVDWLSPNLM